MTQGTCPGGRRLQALLEEGRAGDEADELVHHLESCPDCQEALQDLAAPPDLWACAAQGLTDKIRAEPALHHLVGRLKEEDPLLAEDGGLSFLRPTDKPGLLGLLDRYEVREEIGRGGMGLVLKALDPDLNRLVAIKVLFPNLANNATARRRFIREAKAAAAVCHDHIVTVHGVSESEGLPYLVMQYVDGESLQGRLDRTGPLDVMEIVCIGLQTASGLAAAHAQGLIHRDIKPANLLLENGVARVKITDFGLARMSDDVGLTQDGVVAGTPQYMAPEQARGEVVDHRADLFSLGSVLYACCTGVPPFRGSTMIAVLSRVREETPASIRSLNPEAPAWLETFIARLMAKDPAERFQSATEVVALLEGYLAHLRQPATVSAPALPRGGVKRFLQRRWLAALVLFTLLGLGMALWFAGGGGADPQGGNAGAAAVSPKLRVEFHQDLHSADLDNSLLRPIEEGMRVRSEAAGVRVTLPAIADVPPTSGLATNALIHGDFEISGSFEILKADRPSTGYGVGVGLYATVDVNTNNSVSLSRRLMPDGWTQFASNRMIPTPNGLHHQVMTLPSAAAAGKLRLQRVGPRLRFFVAEEGQSDFVLLDDVEFSGEDITLVKFEGNTGGSPNCNLDFRLLDFTLRAEKVIDPETGQLLVGSVPSAPALAPRPKKWLLALALCVVIFLSLGAVGWFLMQRSRRAAKKRAEASPSVAPALSFSCSDCSKRLKAKAELSGKKVKCPQCGNLVRVPQPD